MHPKEYSHKQMYSKCVLHIFLNEFPYYIKKQVINAYRHQQHATK
jgi:hypothetical protein